MLTGFRRRSAIGTSTTIADAGGNQPAELTVFRNFRIQDFRPTESWEWLRKTIHDSGGCFGLYGPRGSGKSWLMHRAIAEVEKNGGLGLWFPCPRKYDATDFLLTLTDNLAIAVERRFSREKAIISALHRLRNYLTVAVTALLVFALILYGAYGLTSLGKATPRPLYSFADVYPAWLWIIIAACAFAVAVASVIVFVYNTVATGSLLREASTLRERMRFSASMKLTAAFDSSGSSSIVPSISQSRERDLLERPVSVASLVFEFRNFAASIVKRLDKPLLVCIDELDKIDDTDELRALLRDIKGVFEVDETIFLVSISEEAAASLQIGILQTAGRNEMNSSFYAILSLPPLTSDEAQQLLDSRGFDRSPRLACALGLLAAGNRRELLRMADLCAIHAAQRQAPLDEYTIIRLLADESSALLQQIIRSGAGAPGDAEVKYEAWTALAPEKFTTAETFTRLSVNAIDELWEPDWDSDYWASFSESWRRLLIRLFVAAKVLPAVHNGSSECLLDDREAIADLQEILIMATRDAGVSRLLLRKSFGADLAGRYQPAVRQPR